MSHSILSVMLFLVSIGATSTVQAQVKNESERNSQSETENQAQLETRAESKSQESSRNMFKFTEKDADQWQIVNDGVMGGLSSSEAAMIEGDKMQFSGNLSLKNNGGFASVRSKAKGNLGLKEGDAILLRIKGDGRTYTFNLYTPTQRVAFSFQKEFKTKKGDWIEVKLNLSDFQAKSFGESVKQTLDPTRVNSVGVLLGDKKEGPFEVLIDWIKVVSEK